MAHVLLRGDGHILFRQTTLVSDHFGLDFLDDIRNDLGLTEYLGRFDCAEIDVNVFLIQQHTGNQITHMVESECRISKFDYVVVVDLKLFSPYRRCTVSLDPHSLRQIQISIFICQVTCLDKRHRTSQTMPCDINCVCVSDQIFTWYEIIHFFKHCT